MKRRGSPRDPRATPRIDLLKNKTPGYTSNMVKNTETILIEALQLPVQERAALESRLLASLDEQVDANVDQAWEEEVAKRLKEIDEGAVEMVPWEVVRDDLRRITRGEAIDDRDAV